MSNDTTMFSLRAPRELVKKLQDIAKRENRTLSNTVINILLKAVK